MIRIKEITFEKFLEINPNNTAILKEFELNKIRIVLKNKFRTQKNIAKKLGCSRRLVGMVLKKERNPTLNLTLKICKLSNTNI
ncbi:MAG: hypothetical protein KKA79_01035, partial [Nanoarchaeota archaeon]|nr:hypothetical protein [Nanoarchaeota archaeon]